MDKFINKDIYKKAKAKADKIYKKHSAYKSLATIDFYKEMGGKINQKAKKKGMGVEKWLKEDWRNLTPYAIGNVKKLSDAPKCGNKGKKQGKNPSICRPLKKIDSKTPVLATKYTKAQMKKALELKKQGKRIIWDKL